MESKSKDLLLDRLQKYYDEGIQLTDIEKQQCERIELAFGLLLKLKNKSVAIRRYLKVLESQGIKIHITTAHLDFKKAEKLLLPIHKVSKDMHRLVMIESIDESIRKLQQKQKSVDPENKISERSYLQIQDRINKLIELRIKASGIDKDDPNIPDFSKIQPPILQMNMPPKMESALRKMLNHGVVDVSTFFEEVGDIEDLDFEEENGTEND